MVEPTESSAQNPSGLELVRPPRTHEERLSDQLKMEVKRIELVGNSIFPTSAFSEIISAYQGKVISTYDLFNLRNALTLYYLERGYINSGAIIPDQEVTDGVIKIFIVEGKLNDIVVSGNHSLDDDYVIERLRLGNESILNLNTLRERLKLFHRDRFIHHVNAELVPGRRIGESRLNIDIEENRPYRLNAVFDNRKNPSVGELQGTLYGEVMNMTGIGDVLYVHGSLTGGSDSEGMSYSIPVSAYDTRLFGYYERTNADVIEKPFKALNVESTIAGYAIGLEQPFFFSPETQFTASFLLERRSSRTHLLGRPFSFTAGQDNGKSRATALRVTGKWVNVGASHVVALSSRFSVGFDALNATVHSDGVPDGRYFSWLGQFQWVQRLGDTGITLLLRSDAQLTPDQLLPMEKFGVGGYYSVRGYRENQVVRDNGWVSSIEARFPLFDLLFPESRRAAYALPELAVFYDIGWSENNGLLDSHPRTLSSVGAGLRWNPHERIHTEFYWGHALRKIRGEGEDSLQDSGIHFLMDVKLF
ncbi:MAG: ShlB/FhaC/HecB family hemolysin secretion/activation protein [Gammaproteobacteria bacterium]